MPTLVRRPTKCRPGTRGSKAVRAKRRKYKREFTDACKTNSMKSRLRHLTMKSNGRSWEPRTWIVGQPPLPGVVHRSEQRWATRQKFIRTFADIPHIDEVGKYSGSITAHSNLPPAGLISTVISTIYRRISGLVSKKYRNKRHEFYKWKTLLLRCSAYYALTKNNYYWDRLLAMLRHGVCLRVISAHLHHQTLKLDDHKWFVFGQACLQAYWLTSRGVRRPRDKSRSTEKLFRFRPPVREAEHAEREIFAYDAIWWCFASITSLLP